MMKKLMLILIISMFALPVFAQTARNRPVKENMVQELVAYEFTCGDNFAVIDSTLDGNRVLSGGFWYIVNTDTTDSMQIVFWTYPDYTKAKGDSVSLVTLAPGEDFTIRFISTLGVVDIKAKSQTAGNNTVGYIGSMQKLY